jgi:hypothetical protein
MVLGTYDLKIEEGWQCSDNRDAESLQAKRAGTIQMEKPFQGLNYEN